jgi:hypothetical protein
MTPLFCVSSWAKKRSEVALASGVMSQAAPEGGAMVEYVLCLVGVMLERGGTWPDADML